LNAHIKKIKPDYVFHLAAFSSVGESFSKEKKVYEINLSGTMNMIEAVEKAGHRPRKFLFISSSDIYGHFSPEGKTLKEEQRFNPLSPYAVSKAAGEYLMQYHCRRSGLPAVVARAFNHTGPRQITKFVVPYFCSRLAEIEASGRPGIIEVGNLSARRDLSDVRDIVDGYYRAAVKGKKGEVYQFCSGKGVAIKTILERLIKMSSANIKVKVDKSRFRKTDIPVLRGDNKKAVEQLGWKINYRLNETLRDTLQFWREKKKH
jgi:GDP-4-dehydro-6-deoxy-D-mannose reductase